MGFVLLALGLLSITIGVVYFFKVKKIAFARLRCEPGSLGTAKAKATVALLAGGLFTATSIPALLSVPNVNRFGTTIVPSSASMPVPNSVSPALNTPSQSPPIVPSAPPFPAPIPNVSTVPSPSVGKKESGPSTGSAKPPILTKKR